MKWVILYVINDCCVVSVFARSLDVVVFGLDSFEIPGLSALHWRTEHRTYHNRTVISVVPVASFPAS